MGVFLEFLRRWNPRTGRLKVKYRWYIQGPRADNG